MSSTRVSLHVNAPRERVYRAIIDPNAIAKWMVPTGMTSQMPTPVPAARHLRRLIGRQRDLILVLRQPPLEALQFRIQ
jgi:hypothetical protein